jgi:hypothetical protein
MDEVKTIELVGRFPLRTLMDHVIEEEAILYCAGDEDCEDVMVDVYQ